MGHRYLLIHTHGNVALKTQASVYPRSVKCECDTALMMQVSGSTERREVSEGSRKKEEYFTKFRYMEFKLMTLSARFTKNYLPFH